MSRRESDRVLVELANEGMDCGRVEIGAGQLVERGNDPDVGSVALVDAAQSVGQYPHVLGAHVASAGLLRDHERKILRLHTLGEQGNLFVPEGRRRDDARREQSGSCIGAGIR